MKTTKSVDKTSNVSDTFFQNYLFNKIYYNKFLKEIFITQTQFSLNNVLMKLILKNNALIKLIIIYNHKFLFNYYKLLNLSSKIPTIFLSGKNPLGAFKSLSEISFMKF